MITASPMDDRTGLTLSEASQLVRSKKVSPVELTHECLRRIERLNPKLNAFITVTADSAVAEARQAEAEVQHDRWRGPLHGIPIALKDLVDTAGVHTTAASGVFKDRVPTEDAEIVRRLKAAGAVFLGKLNLQELRTVAALPSVISARFTILGISITVQAALPADLRSLSRHDSVSQQLGLIPAAPSASRQPIAALWASSLLTDV